MTSAPTRRESTARFNLRLHPDTVERVKYWAERQGLSVNEYFALAIEEKIGRANGDYDLPNLEAQRLNQLIDVVTALSTNVNNLETVTVSGFDSLLGLTRGDSYLQDEEDGDLDEISPETLGIDPSIVYEDPKGAS